MDNSIYFMGKCRKMCKPGCGHMDNQGFCLYILDTGHPRPCDPGKDCTCWSSEKANRKDKLKEPACEKKPNRLEERQRLKAKVRAYYEAHGCKPLARELKLLFPEWDVGKKTLMNYLGEWRKEWKENAQT